MRVCGYVITRFAFVNAHSPKQPSSHLYFSATSLPHSIHIPRCMLGPDVSLRSALLHQKKYRFQHRPSISSYVLPHPPPPSPIKRRENTVFPLLPCWMVFVSTAYISTAWKVHEKSLLATLKLAHSSREGFRGIRDPHSPC